MKSPPPPLRFLMLVLGGWTAARAALLLPPLWQAPPALPLPVKAETAAQSATPHLPDLRSSRAKSRGAGTAFELTQAPQPRSSRAKSRGAGTAYELHQPLYLRTPKGPALVSRLRPSTKFILSDAAGGVEGLGTNGVGWVAQPLITSPGKPLRTLQPHAGPSPNPPPILASWAAPTRPAPLRRWSLTAWAFARGGGGGASLAPTGTLGSGQAGARAAWRLNRAGKRPLQLFARAYVPTARPAGAEAALGVEWAPSSRVPLRLAAERRQKLGRDGRSAFGLTVHGGVSDARLGAFRIDAYGQAGVVGARSRDLFADGAVKLSLPLGRTRVGIGAWGAAQPGASRADIGPTVSLRLPLAGRTLTLAADWRVRAAGRAEPGSGPALTLATDF